MTTSIPMSNDSIGFETIVPEGFQFPAGKENVDGALVAGSTSTISTRWGIAILAGTQLHASTTTAGAPRVAIVNQQLAQALLAETGSDRQAVPPGRRDKAWVQIVGVAKTSKYIFIAEPPTEFVYLPYRQKKPQQMIMVAQSAGDPASLVAPLREVVRGLDVNMPIYNVRTMEAVLPDARGQHLQRAHHVVAAMGLMGLGLSIVGLYGLVAYAASTAHARDRHPDGDRRRPRRRPAHGAAAGARAGAGRPRARAGRQHRRRRAAGGGVSDRRRTSGTSCALLMVAPIVLAVTIPRGLHSGPPRVAHQPDAGAAARVSWNKTFTPEDSGDAEDPACLVRRGGEVDRAVSSLDTGCGALEARLKTTRSAKRQRM